MLRPLVIHPPILNSANPWCSTQEQLEELYASPYTGAVTTRTSLLSSFPNDESVHQFTFYNPNTHSATTPNPPQATQAPETGSLNTLGYSPKPLSEYLQIIKAISDSLPDGPPTPSSPIDPTNPPSHKPFIISVTGTPTEITTCYSLISTLQATVKMPLAMEINLSCPNIPQKSPPAYSASALLSYLNALKLQLAYQLSSPEYSATQTVPIGIKTPPYTYSEQFTTMIDALRESAKPEPVNLPCPISFITATNTLGSSLLLTSTLEESENSKPHQVFHHTLNSATGTGIGGLAGAPLHPLALGNVYTIKGLLFQYSELEHVQIIGVGGVEDVDGFRRMRAVGAAAVGVGTALGRKGVAVFEEIGKALDR
ncbi:hypothetical protein B0J11DRAFT_613286 [Dendryphion nanum]|uniref:Dihydroorotate dehydrogenase (fumarate) n=1 Tax=Dendryphion nanum TaxID=256645 RepID=A0A9P9E442_9PLEO|nr:hypothetical protein B0J11DRAFT_613286 [Dendryphion nanum]